MYFGARAARCAAVVGDMARGALLGTELDGSAVLTARIGLVVVTSEVAPPAGSAPIADATISQDVTSETNSGKRFMTLGRVEAYALRPAFRVQRIHGVTPRAATRHARPTRES